MIRKKNKNKLGFTLIELLAVIIILGVLLIIAVPAISRYIDNSRKSTYIDSVSSIVDAVSISVNNLEYPLPSKNEALIIPFQEVELEKGVSNTKSPFAPYEDGKSYVMVTFDGIMYHYYVATLDQNGYAIPLVDSKKLNEDSITINQDAISSNIHSLEDIKKGNILDTNQFTMKYLSKIGNVIKVKLGDPVYEYGSVVQLKDETKWYVLPDFDEDGKVINDSMETKTINLVSYYHMELSDSRLGLQSKYKGKIIEDKNKDKLTYFDDNNNPIYEESDIYAKTQNIINFAKTKLIANGIKVNGSTVDMPSVLDFCGKSYYDNERCGATLSYLEEDGGFWTQDRVSGKNYVITIGDTQVKWTSPNKGTHQNEVGYGIRVVIRDLLKANIDKEATKKLN